MSLSIDDVINERLVSLDLGASERWGAIEEMSALLERDGRLNDLDGFVRAVREREEQGSTGMEMGIAIPHAKSAAVDRPAVAFGRSATGVDFAAPDGTPADLLFLIAAPDGAGDLHLTLLSRLARRLVHDEFRSSLRGAGSPEEIIEILRREVVI